MSYNANNPNQQWQPPVDPSNQQQQLRPFSQQATSISSTSGGVNYQQNQQSYSWADGNTQGQHHATQQSWSWQGQSTTPMVQPPPIISPPAMLMQGASHHQLHQQMHQNTISHSHQALAHHQQVMNQSMASSMSNVTAPMQQTPQPQITYQTMSPQPQPLYQQPPIAHQPSLPMSSQVQSPLPISHQQQYQQQSQHSLPSTSPTAPQPQLQYPSNPQVIYPQTQPQPRPYSQVQIIRSPQPQALHEGPGAQQFPQPPYSGYPSSGQQTIQQQPQQERHDDRVQSLEKQRLKDIEGMNRAGAEINKRLRDLEQSKAQAQSDHEAKNQEVRRLQEQLAAVERQRRQDAERNSQQLAELVRSQATSPPAQAPAFDMSALQRVIRETQTQQLSALDIERVIEEQVSKRLAGMATKADIQNAGAQMQNALSQVPAGLNTEQVQQAVNRELNSVMQDVANRVNQQRRISEQTQRSPQPQRALQSRAQTEFVIEELPDEDAATQHNSRQDSRPQRALPVASAHGTGSAVVPSHPASVPNDVPLRALQRPASHCQLSNGSQYAAIEVGPPRVSNVAASLTPGTALMAQPHTAGTHQHNIANIQPHAAANYPAPTYGQIMPRSGRAPPPLIEAPAPQRQLESDLTPTPELGIVRTRPTDGSLNYTAPVTTQPRQIEGSSVQRQLVAPPLEAEASITSQALVYQGRDVSRRDGPRR